MRKTVLTLVAAALMHCTAPVADAAETRLQDNGQALVNPGMGWTMHFYSNLLCNYGSKLAPSDVLDDFPGLSTVYLRLPWAFVQPGENEYNWEVLDTPAQRWIQAGKRVAFRITATENWMQSGTPEWVFRSGAKFYEVNGYKEPEYDDPVFLQKLDAFLERMARRYDGNPNVAFIDIGHFGMWGEGHTVLTTPVHGKKWGLETQKRIIDLYCKHFRRTQLVISDDFAGHDAPVVHSPIIDYALSKGVSLRDDSILVQQAPKHWYHSGMAGLFWPTMPVVLEHEHMGGSMWRSIMLRICRYTGGRVRSWSRTATSYAASTYAWAIACTTCSLSGPIRCARVNLSPSRAVGATLVWLPVTRVATPASPSRTAWAVWCRHWWMRLWM